MRRAGFLRVVDQLAGDLIRHVGHRPAKFPPGAFLRRRPQHIPIGVHQSDRRRRFMFPLLAVGCRSSVIPMPSALLDDDPFSELDASALGP